MVLYARDILQKDLLALPKETTVLEAAKTMKSARHGFVVIDSPTHPAGLVTEWDIVSKVVAEGRDPATVRLAEIMTTELFSVKASEGIAAISQMMSEKGIRRMLVKEGDQVVGYITEKTVLANLQAYVDKVSSQISRLQAPWF
ncbi:MAG: CBS domain-containing protein [Nitrososphaerales archaeon]|nr:CBS domain-containing protein [Nitrososphaerales archaeon]